MVRRKEAVGVQQDGDSLNEVLLEQFREQMNNLAAAVQLLDPVVREQGEQYEPYLSILYQSMYRMLRLMGNMEYLQLDRQGSLELREASMDLAGLCRELAGQVAPLAELAGVQFTYEEEKGMLLTRGDGRLLRRMLLALIANAVQAAGRGGRAGLRLAVRGARVSLTVWDSGPGLAGQKREGGLLDRPAGPGLGLRVARSIAGAHGGAVVLQQREDRGAQAVVSLPIRPPEKDGMLRTPSMGMDQTGGFSDLLVELAGVLPFEAYTPRTME